MADQYNQYETTYYDAREVRKAAVENQRKRKKRRRRRPGVYLGCVLLVSCLLAGIGWLLFSDMCSLNKDYQEVTLTVAEGDSVGDVAKMLKEEGLIRYKWFFKMTSGVFHAKKWIDPGEYELNSDMDYRALIWNMHDYEQDRLEEEGLVRITIVEGMTVNEIIDLLVENGISNRADLEDACANFAYEDYAFLNDDLIGNVNRMEGYLFPDTYDFNPNKSAVYDIETMLVGFVNHLDGDTMSAIERSGYSMQEIVTMASIIEKEGIGDLEERRNIASVLNNRMHNTSGGTYGYLQLDTTVYYALTLEGKEKTDFPKGDALQEYDSPYNTYRHTGLPVGPICCPGMAAIQAAATPNDTEYYYFAAGKDGVNHFFETYDQHVNFVNSDMYQPD